MKKTLVYSFCFCFMTSAAVAMNLYMDAGSNTQCGGFCLENPGKGMCCPSGSVVTKLNLSASDSATKTVEGLYLNGVKLFEFDGTARTLSSDEIATIRAQSGSSVLNGTTVSLARKEYDKGTLFLGLTESNDGTMDFVESEIPSRGNNCDTVQIILVKCRGYTDNYQGQTCYSSSGCQRYCLGARDTETIYYKPNVGYFSAPDYTEAHRYKDATHPNAALTLQPPTLDGYTFRGYFTSWFASSMTDRSSYIANYPPYRTIGHSNHISWASTNRADGLYLRAPNWTISSDSCKMYLFPGWAKNCEDDRYCKLNITGQDTEFALHNGYVHQNQRIWKLGDKSSISGKWLPGGVDYERIAGCPNGENETGKTSITLKYDGTSETQILNTYALGCEEPAANPTQIRLIYHGDATVYDYCNIGEKVQIKNRISNQTIFAVAYQENNDAIFNAGQEVYCKVGTGGFTVYTKGDDYYDVNLYPVAPSMTQIQIKYTVDMPTEPGEGGLVSAGKCSETVTCNLNEMVALKQSLTCSDNNVSISKWTRADGTDISGFSTYCNVGGLGNTVYSNGIYTSTLTGTVVEAPVQNSAE